VAILVVAAGDQEATVGEQGGGVVLARGGHRAGVGADPGARRRAPLP
jgi:hypothetical protein